MSKTQQATLAAACLRQLRQAGAFAFTAEDIAREENLPLNDCREALDRLVAAGAVQRDGVGRLTLTDDDRDWTALDVLKAVWSADASAVALLSGPSSALPWLRIWSGHEWPRG